MYHDIVVESFDPNIFQVYGIHYVLDPPALHGKVFPSDEFRGYEHHDLVRQAFIDKGAGKSTSPLDLEIDHSS